MTPQYKIRLVSQDRRDLASTTDRHVLDADELPIDDGAMHAELSRDFSLCQFAPLLLLSQGFEEFPSDLRDKPTASSFSWGNRKLK